MLGVESFDALQWRVYSIVRDVLATTYLAFKGADYIVLGVEGVPEYVVCVLNGGWWFWGSAPAY